MAIVDILPGQSGQQPAPASGRQHFLGTPFDLLTPETVLHMLGNCTSESPFRYIVTPNVDHVVRLKSDAAIRQYYRNAWVSVCDSRPIAGIARLFSLKLPVVTGSDLTVSIFRSVIGEGDVVTVIASQDSVVRDLCAKYPNVRFNAYFPPQGLWNNPEALQACVDFAAQSEARFIFIAVGSPQSEKIAYELTRYPDARGVGLCIGASLEFLVGAKKRAPVWMQHAGLEWAHRLATDPRRLWRRYAYAVLPLAQLCYGELTGSRSRPGPG